jgi:pimeloyl-ACP methyl ester carboxylesterase
VSLRRRVLTYAAGAAGLAAAGAAVGMARRRRVIAQRGHGDATRLGSLHSQPRTVVAEDGVLLHVEVDDYHPDPPTRGAPADDAARLTVVFVHGFALNLDCWHFQRAGYRGLVRTVFFDQRSHGRSGRSSPSHATIDQLGHDLRQVIDEMVPEGRIVLVGHSMGGMSIIALAEQHPELFGDRITGVALISTTAGGLHPHRLLLPLLPETFGGDIAQRLVAGLARTGRVVESLRRVSKDIAMVATDALAFGDDVPPDYVQFVDEMLSSTKFEVIAEFFPNFEALDKFATISALERIPTTILCGTADKVTAVGHSRKLHAQIPGSQLVECEGAGHMVIIERHEQVNAALDQLIAAAAAHVPQEEEEW